MLNALVGIFEYLSKFAHHIGSDNVNSMIKTKLFLLIFYIFQAQSAQGFK